MSHCTLYLDSSANSTSFQYSDSFTQYWRPKCRRLFLFTMHTNGFFLATRLFSPPFHNTLRTVSQPTFLFHSCITSLNISGALSSGPACTLRTIARSSWVEKRFGVPGEWFKSIRFSSFYRFKMLYTVERRTFNISHISRTLYLFQNSRSLTALSQWLYIYPILANFNFFFTFLSLHTVVKCINNASIFVILSLSVNITQQVVCYLSFSAFRRGFSLR